MAEFTAKARRSILREENFGTCLHENLRESV